jgi:hypothetical protein
MWDRALVGSLIDWYKKLAVGIILIPVALIGGYYVTFWVLRNLRMLMAPLVTGGLVVILPYVFTYLWTGHLNLGQVENTAVAAGGGIVTAVVTTITSKVKESLEKT